MDVSLQASGDPGHSSGADGPLVSAGLPTPEAVPEATSRPLARASPVRGPASSRYATPPGSRTPDESADDADDADAFAAAGADAGDESPVVVMSDRWSWRNHILRQSSS